MKKKIPIGARVIGYNFIIYYDVLIENTVIVEIFAHWMFMFYFITSSMIKVYIFGSLAVFVYLFVYSVGVWGGASASSEEQGLPIIEGDDTGDPALTNFASGL